MQTEELERIENILKNIFCGFPKTFYICIAFKKKAIVLVPWCNGSTGDFGSLGLGSNPSGTTITVLNPKKINQKP